jgi:hypothetical protein
MFLKNANPFLKISVKPKKKQIMLIEFSEGVFLNNFKITVLAADTERWKAVLARRDFQH